MNICFISPFPPRPDGISEFNQDLIHGLLKTQTISYFGVAINVNDNLFENYYDNSVQFQIRKNIREDYVKAASFINNSEADIVCLQLEYSLFGGYDGAYIKDLIKNLTKKLVIVVHGLPINSYSRRPKIRELFFKEISPFVNTFITINPLQKKVLQNWGLKNKIVNILHGAPDDIRNYDAKESKKKLNLEDKTVIFNFGLFHRKKGLEYLIEGFVDLVKKHTDVHLVLAGDMLVTDKKQDYLETIKHLIRDNKIEEKVTIINKFFPRDELYLYISAADIVVLPYIKRDLVSSGPLSFIAFANKFIVTTPYPYAKVLLSKKEAYFVPYENGRKITEAFEFYLTKPKERNQMLISLNKKIETIAWSKIAQEYYHVFQNIVK